MLRASHRFVIAGGGTGGHLFPALAIGDALKKRFPGASVHFVGSKFGLESRILPERMDRYTLLTVRGFMRGLSPRAILRNLLFPFRFAGAYLKSRRLLKRFSPSVVIGTGGYASGLPLLAAIHRDIPTVIHEQNSYPGFTTRWLSSRVDRVCLSYEDARRHLKKKSGVVTGNPVREEIVSADRQESRDSFGLGSDLPVVALLGGSQGARVLNRAMETALDELALSGDVQILWQTGDSHSEVYGKYRSETVKVFPFVDDMASFYGAAEIVVSRAGALALAEIAASGKPSVLVPFAGAAGDHQSKNAESLRAAGAAVVVHQREFTGNRLVREVQALLEDSGRLKRMSTAARSVARMDAAQHIVDEIVTLAEA